MGTRSRRELKKALPKGMDLGMHGAENERESLQVETAEAGGANPCLSIRKPQFSLFGPNINRIIIGMQSWPVTCEDADAAVVGQWRLSFGGDPWYRQVGRRRRRK
jgi:hypothetical protein